MADDRIKGRDAIVGEAEFELEATSTDDLDIGGVATRAFVDDQLPVTTERDLEFGAQAVDPAVQRGDPTGPVLPLPLAPQAGHQLPRGPELRPLQPTGPQLPVIPSRPHQVTGPHRPLPSPGGTAPGLPVISPLPPGFQQQGARPLPQVPGPGQGHPTPHPGYPAPPRGYPPQQPGYPPQQPGYPPPQQPGGQPPHPGQPTHHPASQQPGYPPQQPGYSQQPGYPPQQPGYPPQQPGYPPQQPGYPPQQPGYPPQQPGYPPQQPGYPPQQPGYPPQQPGYPPQQPGYPPQQPGYPPQQPAPPQPGYPAPQPGYPPQTGYPQAPLLPPPPQQQPPQPVEPAVVTGQDWGTIDMVDNDPPEIAPVSRGGAAMDGPANAGIGQDFGNIDLGGDDAPPPPIDTATTTRTAGSLYADIDSPAGSDLELAAVPEELQQTGKVFEGPADVPGLSRSTGNHPAVSDADLGLPLPPPDGAFEMPAPEPGEAVATVDTAKQTAVAELFRQIDKAVKTLNLYEGRGESCVKAVDLAFRLLKEGMSQHGSVVLRITPYEFLVEGVSVYTSKEDRRGMTYRLFRDGVRELEILPMIEREEFGELLEILRRVQPSGGEDDTVTQLWERNLQGIRYQAIDLFLEGMVIAESDDFQAQIDELVQVADQPLHGLERITAGQEVQAQLSAEILEQARAKRQQRLAALQAVDLDARLVQLADEIAGMPDDLWHRTSAIILRMLELGRGAGTVGLMVRLVEQMMLEGRWRMMAVACSSLGEVIAHVRSAGGKGNLAQALQASLGHLCADDKLLSLEGMLAGCTLAQYHLLAELLKILPAQANPQLIRLLSVAPQGEVQDKLVALLRDRHVDLTDHYRDRLQSPNIMLVIYAIHDLRAVGLPRAFEAIKTAADHPSPRVRVEVFRALGDQLDEELLPHLISSLIMDHRELRELAFGMLAGVKAPQLVPKLIGLTRQEEYDAWRPTHREHLLALIVRWGGAESNDYIIRGITASNPLRRKKIDALRDELIAVLRRLGGTRSRKLLMACIEGRVSRQVKQQLKEALQAVDQRAKGAKS